MLTLVSPARASSVYCGRPAPAFAVRMALLIQCRRMPACATRGWRTRALLAAAPRLERGRSPITEVKPAQDVVLASMVARIGSIPKTTFSASRSCIGAR